MRAWLGMVFAVATLTGCSWVYDTSEYFDGRQVELSRQLSVQLVEGETDTVLVLQGNQILPGAELTLELDGEEVRYLGPTRVSSDGTLIARALDVPVLDGFDEGDDIGAVANLQQQQEGERMITASLALDVRALDELSIDGQSPPEGVVCESVVGITALCTINQAALKDSYSVIRLNVLAVALVGPVRRLHATRSITANKVLAGGDRRGLGGWTLGPGAGLGGDINSPGQPEATGGGPGGDAMNPSPRGAAGGGGAGAGEDGSDSNPVSGYIGTHGATIGTRLLLPVAAHGGGGGGGGETVGAATGGVGGSGGGVLWLSATSITVAGLSAQGQAGEKGDDPLMHDCESTDVNAEPDRGGAGGSGGGGAVFIQATRFLAVTEQVDVSGGPGIGGVNLCPYGGTGGNGRIRLDVPDPRAKSDLVDGVGGKLTRGPSFFELPPIATSKSVLVQFVAETNVFFDVAVNGVVQRQVLATPIGTALLELTPGVNDVCLAIRDTDVVGPESITCRQVAYLP